MTDEQCRARFDEIKATVKNIVERNRSEAETCDGFFRVREAGHPRPDYRYLLNINHPTVKKFMEHYKAENKISGALSDGDRFQAEAQCLYILIKKYGIIATEYPLKGIAFKTGSDKLDYFEPIAVYYAGLIKQHYFRTHDVHEEDNSSEIEKYDERRKRFDFVVWAFPNKKNLSAAFAEWERLDPGEGLTEIMLESLKLYNRCPQWLEGDVPSLAAWLHDRAWENPPDC